MKKLKFKGTNCKIEMGIYSNGRQAIELVNIKTDEPVLVATINVPNVLLKETELIIKNYSENEGILSVLINANIISQPLRYIDTGLVSSPVCKLI